MLPGGATSYGDPTQKHQFTVMVTNPYGVYMNAYFSEISGFSAEVATIEYKTFNHNTGKPEVQILPGRQNSGTLTLKRGLTTSPGFWEWHQLVLDGRMSDARSTVTIGFFNRLYIPIQYWTLFEAWPSKFELDSMQAGETGFRMESLTLVYERMEYVKPEPMGR